MGKYNSCAATVKSLGCLYGPDSATDGLNLYQFNLNPLDVVDTIINGKIENCHLWKKMINYYEIQLKLGHLVT